MEPSIIHSLSLKSAIQSYLSDRAGPSVETMTAFERFQELPKDLRRKIWKLALPGSRLVDICSYFSVRITRHRSMPSLLHVCSESRHEALQWYTKLPPCRARYINFEIDTLYVRDVSDFSESADNWRENGLGNEQVTNNARFLAITERAWKTPASSKKAIGLIQRFAKLEKLTVVLFDDGIGEITDESFLDVCDEWQIGDEVGVAIRTSEIPIPYDSGPGGFLELIEEAVMTKEGGGLKNIKVRIVLAIRASSSSMWELGVDGEETLDKTIDKLRSQQLSRPP